MLDPLGFPTVDGGMSCSLRDLARLGLAYLQDGSLGGRQVIPTAWVEDTRHGDEACIKAFADSPQIDHETRDWSMYRNAFWVLERAQAQALHANDRLISRALVDALHGLGVDVNVWTVNEAGLARRLEHMGVDGVFCDRPAELRASVAGRPR